MTSFSAGRACRSVLVQFNREKSTFLGSLQRPNSDAGGKEVGKVETDAALAPFP